MKKRSSPEGSGEPMDENISRVHPHGPVDGERDRRVVWPLAGSEGVRERMGRRALVKMLSDRDMNGRTPELVVMPGSIVVDLGRVGYGAAAAIAQAGIEALDAAEHTLHAQITDGTVEANVGVGISASVVTFPDPVEQV